MPMVGTSSLQKQVDTSIADCRRGSVAESLQDRKLGANGRAHMKRERSHQDLDADRAEMRAKVENSVSLSSRSVNDNRLGSTVPHKGVEEYQDTSPGDELATERDDLRPLVSSLEISAPTPNDTDLTDLLNDLDDAGASDLDEDEFGGGSHLWREALCYEWLQNRSINGKGVQAHSPQAEAIAKALSISPERAQRDGDGGAAVQAQSPLPETITKALNILSERVQRDGDGEAVVQAQSPLPETISKALELSSEQTHMNGDIEYMVQSHDTVTIERPSTEIVILDSDSDDDDDMIMYDHLGETFQLKNIVQSEPGTQKLEMNISQLEGAVKIEPECLTQPERRYELENAVKVEPEIQRHPEKSFQLKNAVKVEPGNLKQLEKSSELVPNEIPDSVPNEMSDLVPSYSSDLGNSVKLEFGDVRRAPDSTESRASEASTVLSMHRGGQEQMGVILQTVMKDGRLMWAVVPPNADATLGSPYSVNLLQSRLLQANSLPSDLPNGVGCASDFAPKIEREFSSAGEQSGPCHGSIATATSADVPFYIGHTQLSGMGNGNHAIGGQAVVSVPSPSQPSGNVQEAAASGEQAGPSHGRTAPISSAVVPYHYDSSVSNPRFEVTRALQQYVMFINKAKDDRHRESLAQSKSSSDELVKEGNRRGLECRPDIVAYNDIKKAKADVNPGVNVGDLPGIEVGDTFTYRHQMAVVGLHRLPNVGIDYGYPPPDMIPTATAVVMMPKTGYVDDKDHGNTIFYTGQGGRKKRNQQAPLLFDQKLKRGNLALCKNFERKLPVRVIRGHTGNTGSGPGFLGYSYDGLYTILSYDYSDGINGFKVYKYHMERLEDQPPIPLCIRGCTAHAWNSHREILAPLPLQAKDPTLDPTVDVKPNLMQAMSPPAEMKQICI